VAVLKAGGEVYPISVELALMSSFLPFSSCFH
jgi:hypothetical protein